MNDSRIFKYGKRSAVKVAALLVLLAIGVSFVSGCGVECPQESVTPQCTEEAASIDPTCSPQISEQPGRIKRTTLYYRTDEGYIYPVNAEIPWEDGIAKACLMRLVDTAENRRSLQGQGLCAVIPDGTGIELDISNGHATVNLVDMPRLSSAEDETAMFVSIVNTLTEFSGVDTVSIFLDGRSTRTPNGNTTPNNQGPYRLNVEDSEIATSGSAKPITIYFPNASGSLNIPITRYVEGADDLYACINGLVSGTNMEYLRSCFPEDTLLLGAAIENGVLTVNLSSDFTQIAKTPGLYELAYDSVMTTAMQFGSVNEVRFTVNGENYEP